MTTSPSYQPTAIRRMRDSYMFVPRRIRTKVKSPLNLAILAIGFTAFATFVIRINVRARSPPWSEAKAETLAQIGAKEFIEPRSPENFSWQVDTAASELNETLLIAPKNFFSDYDFVYVVHSRVQDHRRRDAVRKSWAKDVRRSGIGSVVFLLGYNASFQTKAQHEADTYNDIVQYDFIENYGNLTRKSVAMLRWADGALSNNSILVKSDDDTSINVPHLQATLQILKETMPEFIAGKIHAGTKPIRDPKNKWFVAPDDYVDEKYPLYMSGCLYIISANLIAPMFQATKTTKMMSMEDVYITGILGDKLRLSKIDLREINSYEVVEPCEMHKQLARHYVSAEDLMEDHRILTTTVRICKTWIFTHNCWCESSTVFNAIDPVVNTKTIGDTR